VPKCEKRALLYLSPASSAPVPSTSIALLDHRRGACLWLQSHGHDCRSCHAPVGLMSIEVDLPQRTADMGRRRASFAGLHFGRLDTSLTNATGT
jgi:hypothetical protein